MPADFVARLGSRALFPSEVRSSWGIEQYVALLAGSERFDAVVHRLAHRQARGLRRVDPKRVLALLAALADPPTAELNKAKVAAAADIPATTISPYVDVLVELGVIRLMSGSRSWVANRAVARPLAVFTDPAMARHLAGIATDDLAELGQRRRLAPLLKGIVLAELLRQQAVGGGVHDIGHLRERNGLKVDVVVELADHTVYGLEIRTASSVRPHQFDALESLAARAGARFRGGVVLNTAATGHVYRPGLWSLPISSLWEAVGESP